jgi:sulfate/thiosulfate transport system permease protein
VGKVALRVAALGYLALLIAVPVCLVLRRTLDSGMPLVWQAVTAPFAVHALYLSMLMVLIAVPVNTAFGVLFALLIVRHRFPGKSILSAFIDLPLGVSPIVTGLALVLVYGQFGLFGPWLTAHGIQVVFALPGIALATMFVSLPFVAREVIPVLEELGTEQEQAAHTLGASEWQSFWRITLPGIRVGIGYGVVLSTARALGEFGAVTVVSGNLLGQTETLPLYVQDRFQQFDTPGAYAASVELALLAVLTLVLMRIFHSKASV